MNSKGYYVRSGVPLCNIHIFAVCNASRTRIDGLKWSVATLFIPQAIWPNRYWRIRWNWLLSEYGRDQIIHQQNWMVSSQKREYWKAYRTVAEVRGKHRDTGYTHKMIRRNEGVGWRGTDHQKRQTMNDDHYIIWVLCAFLYNVWVHCDRRVIWVFVQPREEGSRSKGDTSRRIHIICSIQNI